MCGRSRAVAAWMKPAPGPGRAIQRGWDYLQRLRYSPQVPRRSPAAGGEGSGLGSREAQAACRKPPPLLCSVADAFPQAREAGRLWQRQRRPMESHRPQTDVCGRCGRHQASARRLRSNMLRRGGASLGCPVRFVRLVISFAPRCYVFMKAIPRAPIRFRRLQNTRSESRRKRH